MFNLILFTLGILLLTVFLLLFRIQSLVQIAQGSKERTGIANKVNGFLIAFIPLGMLIIGIWHYFVAKKSFLPEASSIHGKLTDEMFWESMAIVTIMFLLTNILLFAFASYFQYDKNRKAEFHHDNTRLEIFWTLVPALIMTYLVFNGNNIWWKIKSEVPKDAEVVEIMGHQFAWKVRYPGSDKKMGSYDFRLIDNVNEMGINFEDKSADDDFMSGEMHLPVNKPVLFKIRARDVLHSVFAPHFRLKQDAVPGMPTSFHFTPTKTTAQMRTETGNPNFNYEIACTEVCGKGHFAMKFIVVV